MRTCSACQDGTSNSSVLRRTSANMPRVRWRSVFVWCIISNFFWISAAAADCWFEDQKHKEDHEVPTAEPCLNCTCRQGALVCYLRVCSELPDPPPPGCIVLHRHRTCCPELICTDIPTGNGIEARSEPDQLEIGHKKSPPSIGNACVENGTIYGPGSAMGSSTLCEYCYCIGGKQTCIKPKCLLHLEGCVPSFEAHSCCPIRYNCTGYHRSITTTTPAPKDPVVRGGCIVSGTYYTEGSRVLGVGHSICDNCYCLRGVLRCEPLSCAPAILGCTPVIKPGECCAASYNCNGTIEIQPEPNYGHYPTISKEYAKLRKQVQQRRPPSKLEKRTDDSSSQQQQQYNDNGDGTTYYVIAESPSSSSSSSSSHTSTTKTHRSPAGSFGTTRHILDPSTRGPFYYYNTRSSTGGDLTPLDIRTRPSTSYNKRKNASSSPTLFYGTTNYEFQNVRYKKPFLTTNSPRSTTGPSTVGIVNSITLVEQTTPKQVRSSDYEDKLNEDVFLSIVDSLFDNEINRNDSDNGTVVTTSSTETVTKLITTQEPTTTTTTEAGKNESFNLTDVLSTLLSTLTESDFQTTSDSEANGTTTVFPGTESESTAETTTDAIGVRNSTTLTTLVTTTDCVKTNDSHRQVVTENRTAVEDRHDVFGLTITDINEINDELTVKPSDLSTTTEELQPGESTSTISETVAEKDVTEVDLESKVKVDTITPHPFQNVPSELEVLLNISSGNKNKDYEDYDYNEPTLPPSLPNLRIIPFVAADALDAKKTELENTVYPLPPERITESPPYSLFSPPIKTEGGFVPKEPPILHDYYESSFHTTGVDITSVTGLPPPAITNSLKSHEHNCITNGHEVRHGETVTAEDCIICVCFYGNIACQTPQCPQPGPGCRRATREESLSCCPRLICDTEEAPTVVLDRIDVTSNPQEIVTIADRVATPDPFRDVIRTEPAPDLQSLIGDIMPYLARHSSTQKMTTPNEISTTELPPGTSTRSATAAPDATPSPSAATPKSSSTTERDELSFNRVLELLLYGGETATTEKDAESVSRKSENRTASTNVVAAMTSLGSTTESGLETREIPGNHNNNNNNIQEHPNSVDSGVGVGLLKLAGCNIYGRMYRVGRIISELSGPCLECKCTEVGVQCTPLKC